MAFPAFETILRFSRDASAAVKSMTTSPWLIICSRLEFMETPDAPPPEKIPASLPRARLPGLSSAPNNSMPSVSRMMLIILLPILPAAPVTIAFIIQPPHNVGATLCGCPGLDGHTGPPLRNQSIILHDSFELIKIPFRHRA